MGDRYITPEIDTLDMAVSNVLCLSDRVYAGNAEGVDRMEFDW